MKRLIILLISSPLITQAQTLNNNVCWVKDLTWDQIIEKAEENNKYIFVDCFTTWCGPCKRMDMEVYSSESVIKFLNDKFISVRIQMDKTKNDKPEVKSWYKNAEAFQKKYQILEYPTLIFLSPKGEIVHRQIGFKSVPDFLAEAKEAIKPGTKYEDPYKQYKNLISDYLQFKRNYDSIPFMINTAKRLGDREMVDLLTNDYLNYLKSIKNKYSYTKENLIFISDIVNSKSTFFYLFYPSGKTVDSIMNNSSFSERIVDRIIQQEIVYPLTKIRTNWNLGLLDGGKIVDGTTQPNWRLLYRRIKREYNSEFAHRNVKASQIAWYEANEDWAKYSSCFIKFVKKYGIDTSNTILDAVINNFAWNAIFLHSSKYNEIKFAAKCMEGVITRNRFNPPCIPIDTYANLLYKIGKRENALYWECEALRIAEERHIKKQIEVYESCIDKIQREQPTWK
jgi:thioredoxin-related protein